jgi:hypothetical protein
MAKDKRNLYPIMPVSEQEAAVLGDGVGGV